MKTRFNRLLKGMGCCLLAAVILLAGTACTYTVQAAELSADYSRTATETGEVTDGFIGAMTDFSFALLAQTVNTETQNPLFSPLSAIYCLALIENGAGGNTLAQMEQALGINRDDLNRSLHALRMGMPSEEDCKVKAANSLWIREDYAPSVQPAFLQANADWHDAAVYATPFDEGTVKDINAWVNENTDGMIKEILDELSGNSQMLLINALLFDAKWQDKYEQKDVREGSFTNADGSVVQVEMMHSDELRYLEAAGFVGFSKDYEGGEYSFVGLLPAEAEGDINAALRGLDGDTWQTLWQSRTHTTVEVKIPEFESSMSFRLNDALAALGMSDMFDEGRADFSEMGPDLYCSSVNQKVVIKVDRNGTKAAAVTWGDMCGTAAPPEDIKRVYLDRPFVYAIVHNDTGLPLFVGAVSRLP